MKKLRRLLVPTVLACALLAALALAATASAEVRAGETTSPENPAISGKGDILKATASYDTTGAITFNITTREPFGENDELNVAGVLGQPYEGNCRFSETSGLQIVPPLVEIYAIGRNPEFPEVHTPPSWIELNEGAETGGLGRATRTLDGTTTTLKATSSELAAKPFTCAFIAIQTPGTAPTSETPGKAPVTLDEVSFLLSTVPTPPAPPAPPAPQPPTPALSIATPSPVTAKAGKWTKVQFKVANPGGAAVGPIAFKAKAPAGVIVRPGAPKLPALLAGQTWTVNLQVKLTEKAKPKSTITLTGTSGALTATGSVLVKAAG
jgi:hypothetical protein